MSISDIVTITSLVKSPEWIFSVKNCDVSRFEYGREIAEIVKSVY